MVLTGPTVKRENSLELIDLFSINKFSLAWIFSCSNTGSIRDDFTGQDLYENSLN